MNFFHRLLLECCTQLLPHSMLTLRQFNMPRTKGCFGTKGRLRGNSVIPFTACHRGYLTGYVEMYDVMEELAGMQEGQGSEWTKPTHSWS
mmetsp:Transcript_30160/g.41491  ORF Transcript_30160/g.41491 Transcript_30160/m.41491 type:complete len:90 (-) Transcript_30160:430-699(-)